MYICGQCLKDQELFSWTPSRSEKWQQKKEEKKITQITLVMKKHAK